MRWLKSWGWPLALIVFLQVMSDRGLLENGAPLPPIEGEMADGQRYDGASLEKGPFLVYVWGSWCWVCRSMEGVISRVSKDHRVLTVALRSGDRATVADYLSHKGLAYPALVDDSGQLADALGVKGVPALFFVDGAGRIQSATQGYTSEAGIRLRLWRLGRRDQ